MMSFSDFISHWQKQSCVMVQGENFLGRLGTLRSLLGKEGAQAAVRKAPYLLLEENQRPIFESGLRKVESTVLHGVVEFTLLSDF